MEKWKTALKNLAVIFGFFWITGIIVTDDPETKRLGIMIVLLVAAVVGVYFLLKSGFAAKILIRQRRENAEYRRRQPMESYDPAEISGRDAQRRIEQLDNFLASGIIDKKEYAELKAKYQNRM